MNNKGMTLIELIAVIAIIAIITLMIAPNIIEMRRQTIESNVDNKVVKIQNAAINYAEDNISSVPNEFTTPVLKSYSSSDSADCIDVKTFDRLSDTENYSYCENYCLIVYISSLIEKGYLAGDSDDKTQLIHPLLGTSLNNERVCVRYDTNKVIRKVENNETATRKLVAYIVDQEKMYADIRK